MAITSVCTRMNMLSWYVMTRCVLISEYIGTIGHMCMCRVYIIYVYMIVYIYIHMCVWHNMTYVYSSIPFDLFLAVFQTGALLRLPDDWPSHGILGISCLAQGKNWRLSDLTDLTDLTHVFATCKFNRYLLHWSKLMIMHTMHTAYLWTFPFCLTADGTTRTTQDRYRQQCQGSISILSSGYLVAGNVNLHRTDEWNVGCSRLQVQYWTWRTPTTVLYL
jgi:hypothetical protein